MKRRFLKTESAVAHSRDVLEHHRLIYTNAKALELYVAQLEGQCILIGQNAYNDGEEFYHFHNAMTGMIGLARDKGAELAGAKACLDAMLKSPVYQEAASIIEPLREAEAQQAAREEEARQAKLRKEAALNQALEAAKGRAMQNAENDPAVIAARRALAE